MRTLQAWLYRCWCVRVGGYVILLLSSSFGAWAMLTDLRLVRVLDTPAVTPAVTPAITSAVTHNDQLDFKRLAAARQARRVFEEAFKRGERLFNTPFNALDGVGANVGEGQRFTRVPGAELRATGAWATHTSARTTGPQAQSCGPCHSQPGTHGAGTIPSNAVRDPLHTGNPRAFIQRNPPHLFGLGAVQRLAEEMTEALQDSRDTAQTLACTTGQPVTQALSTKGVSFGHITVNPTASKPCTVAIDTSQVQGVAADLVIRPFQWKGNVAFIRALDREASHNDLGMQAVELVGDGVDGDHDGVVDELSVGDVTALTIYNAAQPRPATRVELAHRGLIPPLAAAEVSAIQTGAHVFRQVGCATCHSPRLTLDLPLFSEPSQHQHFRDAVFPAGQDPVARGVDPAFPIVFDLTHDQLDNQIKDANGRVVYRLGALQRDRDGRAMVELFGDLKRHDMGPELAESIDEVGTGAAVFLTQNLWGVGSTAPYLHDGRATTLTEAILAHGGEAAGSRAAFETLTPREQAQLLAFLNNLVLFKMPAK